MLIGVRLTPFRQRALDGVLPCLVFIVVELFVEIAAFEDLRRVLTLVDDGVHCALERELHVLRQVVFDIDVTVPGEVFAESQVHRFG